MSNKFETIKKIKELAASTNITLASTNQLVEFNRVINNPQSEVSDVVSIVEKDPLLAALILKIANSGLYAQVRNISTVKQAVLLLGFLNIQQIFMTDYLNKTFEFGDKTHQENLLNHSLGTAIAAKNIAKLYKLSVGEQIFSAGLLHDIGSFIIIQHLKEEWIKINELLEEDSNKRLLHAEKQILGVTHQDIGAFFVKEWNFPEIIVASIKHHHFLDSSMKHREAIATVLIANNIAKGMHLGESDNYYVDPIPSWVWSFLKITPDRLDMLITLIRDEYDATMAAIVGMY